MRLLLSRTLITATLFLTVPEVKATDPSLDFNSLSVFWKIVDKLKLNTLPRNDEWAELFNSPYYSFYVKGDGSAVRSLLSLAFMPDKRVKLDSISKTNSWQYNWIKHIVESDLSRAELITFQKALEKERITEDILNITKNYLPRGVLKKYKNPRIVFGIFQPDANGRDIIAVDIKLAMDMKSIMGAEYLKLFLAHEAHHYYYYKLGVNLSEAVGNNTESTIIHLINQLCMEGIADLIDKKYMFKAEKSVFPETMYKIYKENFYSPAQNLLKLDSLIKNYASNASKRTDISTQLIELLPLSGHPHGLYMAKTIYEVFGLKRIQNAIKNSVRFIELYNKAAIIKGNTFVFSAETLKYLGELKGK